MLMQKTEPYTYWTVKDVENLLHKTGKTSYRDLREFLASGSNLRLGPTTRVGTEDFLSLYDLVLLRITRAPRVSHWVLYSRETPLRIPVSYIYDPECKEKLLFARWAADYLFHRGRVTSYAVITDKKA